jgi:thymidine phosphorylase
MRVVELIAAKRDGQSISSQDLHELIYGFTRQSIPDYQMSAFLMAGYLRGFSFAETVALNDAMLNSGERLDLSQLSGPTVDKHSTGGVGDSTTLVVAPLAAALGMQMIKLSGRGLGFTGGTLDKLESIPGMRTQLGDDELISQVSQIGLAVCAQTDKLDPADRAMYALRDVTATVGSPALIASSIMSKKLAGGAETILLDVKVGSGAFMKDVARARELASTMVGLGIAHGVNTVALLTNMDTPLGLTAGNALEVAESLEVLAGGGPTDVVELTVTLAREMLIGCGMTAAKDPSDALTDGSAMDSWRRMIRAQGGDPDAPLPAASSTHVVTAPASGRLTRLDAMAVGVAAWRLGAGRARKEDAVSFGAGVVMHAKPGDLVVGGQPLLTLYADDEARFGGAVEAVSGGFDIGSPDAAWSGSALVLEKVGG